MGANLRIDARILPARRRTDDELRTAPRFLVMIVTSLRALGFRGSDAVVRDLSASGFMAETEHQLIPGETARLELPEIGTVSARVIWTGGGRVAGEFDRPLPRAPLDRLIELGQSDAA